MECTNCGATLPEDSRQCRYCGSPVAGPERAADELPRSDVFERIRRSDTFARATTRQRQAALPTLSAIDKYVPITFGVMFSIVSLIILGGFCTVGGLVGRGFGGWAGGGLAMLFALVPLAFVAVGIFVVVYTVRKVRDFEQAPILARPAVVVGKRTAVSGGGDSRVRTRYYLTCEFEDGRREEFEPLHPRLSAELGEQDAGVLLSRANRALDFDRILTGD